MLATVVEEPILRYIQPKMRNQDHNNVFILYICTLSPVKTLSDTGWLPLVSEYEE